MRYFLTMPISFIGYVQDTWYEILTVYGISKLPNDFQEIISECYVRFIDNCIEEHINDKDKDIDFTDIIDEYFEHASPRYGTVGYMYRIYDALEDIQDDEDSLFANMVVRELRINMYKEPWLSYPETILDVFSSTLSTKLIECFLHALNQGEDLDETLSYYLRNSNIKKYKGKVTSYFSSKSFLITA